MTRWMVLAVLAVAPVAAAEDDPTATNAGEGNVRYQKTTTYDFEGDTIEGDLMKPDGEYIDARKRVKHSNLIRIREEFRDKVMQSVGEL
ncbi:MAG: adventurous gliding motility protein CglF [Myxococcaceae bacterium]|nr:adventurous gliding motility protein CglF [Myxococcaceae bacterium]MCI0672509.1 adventurous gliding motility protein CglF [Myxococcaceae bacterium]